MDDWQIITEAEPWLVRDAEVAMVQPPDQPFHASRQFKLTFPQLTALLSAARQTNILLPTGPHKLFAWGRPNFGVRAWLCSMPGLVSGRAALDHQILLDCFGGIVERFNEPVGNWLLNHNQALTAVEIRQDATFMTAYAWAFEECGGIPIDLAEYYPIAREANGNCVLCSRGSGELLYFAPDHANSDLIPYGRCPLYTLHIHRKANSVRQWVEGIAAQWICDDTGSPS